MNDPGVATQWFLAMIDVVIDAVVDHALVRQP
jgi:hypothetical protein